MTLSSKKKERATSSSQASTHLYCTMWASSGEGLIHNLVWFPKTTESQQKILDSGRQLRTAQTRRMLRFAWVPDPVGTEQSAG